LISLEKVRQRAESDAKNYGYYLNPDFEFLKNLLEGLKQNEDRYGYPACPCRLASGNLDLDRDIICPCDYRDLDVEKRGFCYCALYVRKDAFEGEIPIQQIPDSRPNERQMTAYEVSGKTDTRNSSDRTDDSIDRPARPMMLMWYCKQCGYVCFRVQPPYICPICKAKREMFAEVRISTVIRG